MIFTFEDNKTLKIQDLEPSPIGDTFLDFLTLDLSAWVENIKAVLGKMTAKNEWKREDIQTFKEEFEGFTSHFHPYFKAYEGIGEQSFYMIEQAIIKAEMAKTKELKGNKADLGAINEANTHIKNMLYIEASNIMQIVTEELRKLRIYQSIFKEASQKCLDIDSPIQGENAIDRLYNYGYEKLEPDYTEFEEDIYTRLAPSEELLRRVQQKYRIIEQEGKKIIVEVWEAVDIYPVCYQEFYKLVLGNACIKKCNNCGMYFLPHNRIDTSYCEREYQESGKTCRDIGAVTIYKEKIKASPVLTVYNKAYQSKYAKIKLKKSKKERVQAKADFQEWSKEAQFMKEKALSNKISLEEFTEWLKK